MLRLVWKSPRKLICDNQSVIQIAYNLMYHSKTKNIYLSTHYTLDLIANVVISLDFSPKDQYEVDIFIISMMEETFIGILNLVGMREVVIEGEY